MKHEPKIEPRRICDTCRYFEKQAMEGRQEGICRRYPPQWPVVNANQWCGEYKPKC